MNCIPAWSLCFVWFACGVGLLFPVVGLSQTTGNFSDSPPTLQFEEVETLPPPMPATIPNTGQHTQSNSPFGPNYFHLLEEESNVSPPASPQTDPPQTEEGRVISNARAGYPLFTSKRAARTYDNHYQGYYVGGGVPRSKIGSRYGQPRRDNEGTWGMDYAPWYSRVASVWSHGRLFQGGLGQYEPDHKNRPFGQTFGRHFGNRERRFEEHESFEHLEANSTNELPGSEQLERGLTGSHGHGE